MSSLAARFAEIPDPPTKCKTCLWYSQLSPEDKAFFEEKSTDDRKKLWKACRANGLDAAYTSFRDHLNDLKHRGPR